MTWEVFSIGFGEFIARGLEMVALLFGADAGLLTSNGGLGFGTIPVLLAILGVIYIAARSVLTMRFEFTQWAVAVAVFAALFVPKQDVVVEDKLDGSLYAVDDVPIGLAVAAAVTSQIGFALTDQMSTVFQHPTNTEPTMTPRSFAFPLRLLLEIRNLEATDLGPTMAKNITRYHNDCVVPSRRGGRFDDEAFNQRPWEVYFDPGQLVNGYTSRAMPSGEVPVRCHDQAEFLADVMGCLIEHEGRVPDDQEVCGGAASAISVLAKHIQRQMGGVDSEKALKDNTITGETIRAQLEMIAPGIQSARNFVIGQVVTNMDHAEAAGYGRDPYEATLFTQMLERQRIQAAGGASGMQRMSLMMMGMMQFLFIVVTPIIAVVGLARMGAGFRIYGAWVLLGAWATSFFVIVAILDWWAIAQVRERFTETFENTAALLSLPGLEGLYNYTADILTVSNQFMTFAPYITLALLTGSIFALAGMASRISGINDMETNAGVQIAGDRGALAMPANLSPSANQNNPVSASDLQGQAFSFRVGTALNAMQQASHDVVQQRQEQFQASLQRTSQEIQSVAEQASTALQSGETDSQAITNLGSLIRNLSTTGSDLQGVSNDQVVAEAQRQATTMGVRLGTPPVLGVSGGVGFENTSSLSETQQQAITSALQSMRSVGENVNLNDQHSISSAVNVARTAAQSQIGQSTTAFQETVTAGENYSEALGESERLSESIGAARELHGSATVGHQQVEQFLNDAEALSNPGLLVDEMGGHARAIDQEHSGFMSYLEESGALPTYNPFGENVTDTQRALFKLADVAADPEAPAEFRQGAGELLVRAAESILGTSILMKPGEEIGALNEKAQTLGSASPGDGNHLRSVLAERSQNVRGQVDVKAGEAQGINDEHQDETGSAERNEQIDTARAAIPQVKAEMNARFAAADPSGEVSASNVENAVRSSLFGELQDGQTPITSPIGKANILGYRDGDVSEDEKFQRLESYLQSAYGERAVETMHQVRDNLQEQTDGEVSARQVYNMLADTYRTAAASETAGMLATKIASAPENTLARNLAHGYLPAEEAERGMEFYNEEDQRVISNFLNGDGGETITAIATEGHVPSNPESFQDASDAVEFVAANYYDPVAMDSSGEFQYSNEVHSALNHVAGMDRESEEFQQIARAYEQDSENGDKAFSETKAALEEVGLINETASIEARKDSLVQRTSATYTDAGRTGAALEERAEEQAQARMRAKMAEITSLR